MGAALEQVRRDGGKPYAIPAGASDHPLGGLGYAHFADELAAQEAKEGIFFDTVVTATCTGSTQAGMVVGFAAQSRRRRLIGIDTAANAAMTRAAVTKIARATAGLVGLGRDISDEEIEIDPRFAGPDYGLPDEATIAAIRKAASLEAMLTDPVYEGKSMAGLIAMSKSGEIPRGSEGAVRASRRRAGLERLPQRVCLMSQWTSRIIPARVVIDSRRHATRPCVMAGPRVKRAGASHDTEGACHVVRTSVSSRPGITSRDCASA